MCHSVVSYHANTQSCSRSVILVTGKKYPESRGSQDVWQKIRAHHKFTTHISGYFLPGTSAILPIHNCIRTETLYFPTPPPPRSGHTGAFLSKFCPSLQLNPVPNLKSPKCPPSIPKPPPQKKKTFLTLPRRFSLLFVPGCLVTKGWQRVTKLMIINDSTNHKSPPGPRPED